MTRLRRLVLTMVTVALGGCAPIPPPDVLRATRDLGKAPAVSSASEAAPAARAHADALVRDADRAFDEGDFAGAELLAEQARAAFDGVVVEGRLVRAVDRRVRAEAEERAAAVELARLDVENQRLAADIVALERRIEGAEATLHGTTDVVRPADDERRRVFELSRFEARVACTSGDLLTAEGAAAEPLVRAAEALSHAWKRLGDLDAQLGEPSEAPRRPISDGALQGAAMAARGCLEALSALRSASAVEAGGESLLAELERAGFDANAEREGVVVRVAVTPGERRLGPALRGNFVKLAAVAARRRTPLLVVVRTEAQGAELPLVEAAFSAIRDEAVRGGLAPKRLGGPLVARASAPRVDPAGPYAASNEVIELIFINSVPR